MALTSTEKTRIRNETMNRLALDFSEQLSEFKEYSEKKNYGGSKDVTWRRFEAFLKQKFGMSETPGEFSHYDALTRIAEQVAVENKDFQYFLVVRGEEISEKPTWRRLETFLKQRFEAGDKIKISLEENGHVSVCFVIESSVSGD